MKIDLMMCPDQLTEEQVIFAWQFVSRFKGHNVCLHLASPTELNQYYLSELIFKLDYLNNKQGHDVTLQAYFQAELQNFGDPKSAENFKAFFEQFLFKKQGVSYFVYGRFGVIFSQQSIPYVCELIERKENWFAGDGFLYGKNMSAEDRWHSLNSMYPVISKDTEIIQDPIIGIFDSSAISLQYFTGWWKIVRDKFNAGSEMFG